MLIHHGGNSSHYETMYVGTGPQDNTTCAAIMGIPTEFLRAYKDTEDTRECKPCSHNHQVHHCSSEYKFLSVHQMQILLASQGVQKARPRLDQHRRVGRHMHRRGAELVGRPPPPTLEHHIVVHDQVRERDLQLNRREEAPRATHDTSMRSARPLRLPREHNRTSRRTTSTSRCPTGCSRPRW